MVVFVEYDAVTQHWLAVTATDRAVVLNASSLEQAQVEARKLTREHVLGDDY